jgi:tryptophan synthase alpha chain
MRAATLAEIIINNKNNGHLTLIPFLPAAFPEADSFWPTLAELSENGAGIIEIGVPFSDPVADGPQVAAASERALKNGGGLAYILAGLAERRAGLKCGLVLMGYVNPFIQYGWAEARRKKKEAPLAEIIETSLDILAEKLAGVAVQGLIVPDLPLEESGIWLKVLKRYGLELIALVGPNTSLEKMKKYAEAGTGGYVYVVSVLGTTGERSELPPEVTQTLARAREAFNLPLALGFGLNSPRQLDYLPADLKPDAAVFGSSLIRHLEQGRSVAAFMEPWKK